MPGSSVRLIRISLRFDGNKMHYILFTPPLLGHTTSIIEPGSRVVAESCFFATEGAINSHKVVLVRGTRVEQWVGET